MSTYEWQTFYKQYPPDGATTLNSTGDMLLALSEGQALRRTLFHQQMRVAYSIAPEIANYSQYAQLDQTILAAGLWLNPAVGEASNSPSAISDRNSSTWIFNDYLQSKIEFVDYEQDMTVGLAWSTPAAGLDLQTQRLAVAGNNNDIWLAWQMNDPSGVVNTDETDSHALLGGWLSIRLLIETAS